MFSHLDVYCDTCCSMPGEFCTYKWVIIDDDYPLAQAAATHPARINRSKAEATLKERQKRLLLLPVNLQPSDPRCPGCGGTYEEHAVGDCFESFGRPIPPELPE